MKHLLGILFLFACLLTLSAGGAVAQGLPIRRSPFPVNKSSLKRVKGLEAVPIPDNIESTMPFFKDMYETMLPIFVKLKNQCV